MSKKHNTASREPRSPETESPETFELPKIPGLTPELLAKITAAVDKKFAEDAGEAARAQHDQSLYDEILGMNEQPPAKPDQEASTTIDTPPKTPPTVDILPTETVAEMPPSFADKTIEIPVTGIDEPDKQTVVLLPPETLIETDDDPGHVTDEKERDELSAKIDEITANGDLTMDEKLEAIEALFDDIDTIKDPDALNLYQKARETVQQKPEKSPTKPTETDNEATALLPPPDLSLQLKRTDQPVEKTPEIPATKPAELGVAETSPESNTPYDAKVELEKLRALLSGENPGSSSAETENPSDDPAKAEKAEPNTQPETPKFEQLKLRDRPLHALTKFSLWIDRANQRRENYINRGKNPERRRRALFAAEIGGVAVAVIAGAYMLTRYGASIGAPKSADAEPARATVDNLNGSNAPAVKVPDSSAFNVDAAPTVVPAANKLPEPHGQYPWQWAAEAFGRNSASQKLHEGVKLLNESGRHAEIVNIGAPNEFIRVDGRDDPTFVANALRDVLG